MKDGNVFPGIWKLLPGKIKVEIMCQQDCRSKTPPTVACTLENAINIDTNLSFCAAYHGILTRSEGDKKCKSLNARLPLPKSKKDFNMFALNFKKLIPKNETGYNLFVDMTYKSKSGRFNHQIEK